MLFTSQVVFVKFKPAWRHKRLETRNGEQKVLTWWWSQEKERVAASQAGHVCKRVKCKERAENNENGMTAQPPRFAFLLEILRMNQKNACWPE
jgi:hypothetical protein